MFLLNISLTFQHLIWPEILIISFIKVQVHQYFTVVAILNRYNYIICGQITNALEQRCYKELRNENLHSTKIVMCIYRKLLFSCKEQMWVHIPSIFILINRWLYICIFGCFYANYVLDLLLSFRRHVTLHDMFSY
jgi:hypothetical protein